MKTVCIALYLLAATFAAAADSQSLVNLTSSSPTLQLNLKADPASARITTLGWDTEGTNRAGINLLKAPIELRLIKNGQPLTPPVRVETPAPGAVRYAFDLGDGKALAWEIAVQSDMLRMQVSSTGDAATNIDQLELVFPFEPATAVTSIVSSNWTKEGKFLLPSILSAPDLGQMLITCPGTTGRIEGNRAEKWVTVTLELPLPNEAAPLVMDFTPVVLPMPDGFHNDKQWKAARRGWFNLIQQSCGASGGSRDVIGVWANNVLSDPVSSVVYMLGDATLLVPELAPGVSMPPILRRTVEYWIDCKTNKDGLIAYTARGTAGSDEPPSGDVVESQNVLDANPAVLIGAWCYVKASGDLDWLKARVGDLEFLSKYMEGRDIDGDGLIESKQSGNSGSRPPRDPDNAWDCYASGHKDAYNNVLAYRAWHGLADLERMLGRTEQEQKYLEKAALLKAAFLPVFFNPETGWLGWWRSRDGMLHDIHSDVPTSFAINYGVLDKDEGKPMLETYWRALRETGFDRFDLGTPVTIRPIPREEMEVYFEFQQFLNGGCCVSNTSYLLNALSITGMDTEADLILDAMLKRQHEGVFENGGGFQNGFVDRMSSGAEVFDWKGNPAGYEGHLVYCWAFLHSMLMQEPDLRERVYEGLF